VVLVKKKEVCIDCITKYNKMQKKFTILKRRFWKKKKSEINKFIINGKTSGGGRGGK